MRTLRFAQPAVFAALLLLGWSTTSAATASAAELFGGPLEPGASNRLDCRIVNVGSKAIDVVMDVFDGNGNLIRSSAFLGLVPLRGTIMGTTAAAPPFPRVCKFSGTFAKTKVRATVSVVDPSAGAIAAVEAH